VPDATSTARSSVASQRIAEELRERILSGQLAPGARIKQDELAEELQTSRLPVREALRILESRGLVTLRSNQGAWVASMDLRQCELSYQMRERLEPLLLAESAHIENTHEVEQFLILDRQLHWTMYRHHDAAELATIVARLWDTTQHYRRAFTSMTMAERKWIISAEHRLLIEALRDCDIKSAAHILELHVRRTRTELGRHPELFGSGA
jgi:DNA-binding GntR family transcriptional regulator